VGGSKNSIANQRKKWLKEVESQAYYP
jgi:hypothetical protein